MDKQNEQDDAQFFQKWREEQDKKHERQLIHAREMGFLVKKETWIPGDAADFEFLREESVSGIEWLSGVFRFRLREERQVIVTLHESIIWVYLHRLPRSEEEARIVQYMLALLNEGREKDKEMIEELLPRFERYFEFADFRIDYNEETKPPNSEFFREIMAYLVKKENQRTETIGEENSPYPEDAGN